MIHDRSRAEELHQEVFDSSSGAVRTRSSSQAEYFWQPTHSLPVDVVHLRNLSILPALYGSRRVHRRGSMHPHSRSFMIQSRSRLHVSIMENILDRELSLEGAMMHAKRPLDAGNVSNSGYQKQAPALCRGPRGWPSAHRAGLGSGCGLKLKRIGSSCGKRRDTGFHECRGTGQ